MTINSTTRTAGSTQVMGLLSFPSSARERVDGLSDKLRTGGGTDASGGLVAYVRPQTFR